MHKRSKMTELRSSRMILRRLRHLLRSTLRKRRRNKKRKRTSRGHRTLKKVKPLLHFQTSAICCFSHIIPIYRGQAEKNKLSCIDTLIGITYKNFLNHCSAGRSSEISMKHKATLTYPSISWMTTLLMAIKSTCINGDTYSSTNLTASS